MKPYDKQGRPLFGKTWDRVHHYGTQLIALGYQEHTREPNLFVRAYPSIEFYADLRGSKVIDIWEDPRPLFWWRARRKLDRAVQQRMISIEATRTSPVPIRLSFRLDALSLEIMREMEDHSPFQRPEPESVPRSPVPGAPYSPRTRERTHFFEALDAATGELVPASAKAAGGSQLLCPDCRSPVRRSWNHSTDSYYLRHLGKACFIDEA